MQKKTCGVTQWRTDTASCEQNQMVTGNWLNRTLTCRGGWVQWCPWWSSLSQQSAPAEQTQHSLSTSGHVIYDETCATHHPTSAYAPHSVFSVLLYPTLTSSVTVNCSCWTLSTSTIRMSEEGRGWSSGVRSASEIWPMTAKNNDDGLELAVKV